MIQLENIKITTKILSLVAEVDEFKGAWFALEKHSTELQLLGDVADYGQNFKAVLGPWQNIPLGEDVIQKLHMALLGKRSDLSLESIGRYREGEFPLIVQKEQRIIGSLDVAPHEDVKILFPKLIEWTQGTLDQGRFHPLLVIGLFSAVFLQISPFETGNQRLLRMLITLMMLKAGYTYAPYSSLEQVMQEHLDEYYKALSYTQETLELESPNWEPWLLMFLNLLKDQKDRLKKRLDNRGKEMASMPMLSTKILKLFENHERLSMQEIEKKTKGKRSTLKLRLKELVDGGYLTRHGKARATWYAKV